MLPENTELGTGEFTTFNVSRSEHILCLEKGTTSFFKAAYCNHDPDKWPYLGHEGLSFWHTWHECGDMLELPKVGTTVKTRTSSLKNG